MLKNVIALFCRSRHVFASPEIRVRRNDRQFVLELPAGWLGRNAMSAAALEDEVVAWSRAGFEFKVKSFSAKSTRKAD